MRRTTRGFLRGECEGTFPTEKSIIDKISLFNAINSRRLNVSSGQNILRVEALRVPVRTQDVVCFGNLNGLWPADGREYFGERNPWPLIFHTSCTSACFISSMISAMRFSFWRMLSASCSGGNCSRFSFAVGFLTSRLTERRFPFSSYFRTSSALTFQASPFPLRLLHHSRHGLNSSNCNGCVFV